MALTLSTLASPWNTHSLSSRITLDLAKLALQHCEQYSPDGGSQVPCCVVSYHCCRHLWIVLSILEIKDVLGYVYVSTCIL